MKKYIIVIILAIFFIGLIIGFNNNYDLKNFYEFTFSWQNLLASMIFLILGLILSLLGLPIYLIMLLFEIILMGIVTSYFLVSFSFKGILFVFLYTLVFKCIYWFLLFLNSFYAFKMIKNEMRYLFKKYRDCKNNIKLYFKKILVINSFIITFICFTNTIGIQLINICLKFFIS